MEFLALIKFKDGSYLKITPLEGYDKFLASLAWSLTTDEGYNANLPKYSRANESIHIPANKLVFMIPATKGSVHGGMTYV
ncbi:hypothetical protein CDV26_10800 [Francisella halioticida]|uniref:Uncharacterized protein n=1 Tax=Francisella halioticida TaxID=549298 RepID=A0ABN5AY51_9GAMM|nr:hypothetical protein CDV26_10800 [Francisella halioticida]